MHLIAPLCSGVNGCANGFARLFRRGTALRASWYNTFEASTAADSSGADIALDSNGGVVAYVNELVEVDCYSSTGVLVRSFIAGSGAYGVEAISPAFTGIDYETGVSAVSEPTTVGAILDLWIASAGAPDWKGLYNGSPTLLSYIFGALRGLIFNVKSPQYGALGDGTTDDTAAIQAAYTAAGVAGGIVVFPPGVYNHSSEFTCSTGVSTFAVPGTVTWRSTTAATSSLRMQTALASGPDTPTVIYGIRFDSTVTNNATQVIIGHGSSDEVHVVACRFGGSAFATGAGISLGGTLTWKTVVRDCYFQAQAAVYCIVDTAAAGAGSIVLEGCQFLTPAAAYGATMVYSADNALIVRGCRFAYQGTSGTSIGVQNANTAKPVQVSTCVFETLSGSSTNYGVQLIVDMRVCVDDDNYFTGVTRYYQPASTDLAESTRSYLAMGSATTGVISGTTNTVPDFVRAYSLRSTNAVAPTITMPKLAFYGQQLTVVVMNDSGGSWIGTPVMSDAPGVGTSYLFAAVTPDDQDLITVQFVGVQVDGSPYWVQVGASSEDMIL